MRLIFPCALAAEAGVGFATPFNHFGSKNEIVRALTSCLIERITANFLRKKPKGDFIDRVVAMSGIAIDLLLERPEVYKAVIGSLSVASATPSAVMAQSSALWSIALGDLEGVCKDAQKIARLRLAEQLAFTFRGCLSFWIAGEIKDDHLAGVVQTCLCTMLLGFVNPKLAEPPNAVNGK